MSGSHVSDLDLDRYLRRSIAPVELLAIDQHLGACERCRQRLFERAQDAPGTAESRRQTGSTEAIALNTADMRLGNPTDEQLFVGGHLTYEAMAAIVDSALNPKDRSSAMSHLRTCAGCSEEFSDLQKFASRLTKGKERGLIGSSPILPLVDDLEVPSQQPKKVSILEQIRSRTMVPRLVAAGLLAAVIVLTLVETTEKDVGIITAPKPPSPGPSGPVIVSNSPAPYSYLPDEFRSVVLDSIHTQTLSLPKFNEARAHDTTTRGLTLEEPCVAVSPVQTVTLSRNPVFRWETQPRGAACQVRIYDSNLNLIVESPAMTAGVWESTKSLKAGIVYLWTLKPATADENIASGTVDPTLMSFRVLSPGVSNRLEAMKHLYPADHFALGVLYAHYGVLDEAEHELNLVPASDAYGPTAAKFSERLKRMRDPGHGGSKGKTEGPQQR